MGLQEVSFPWKVPLASAQESAVRISQLPPAKQQAPLAGVQGLGEQSLPTPRKEPSRHSAAVTTVQLPSGAQHAPVV